MYGTFTQGRVTLFDKIRAAVQPWAIFLTPFGEYGNGSSLDTVRQSSRMATLSMAHQLMMASQKRWRRLKGCELIAKVITGVKFENEMEVAS